MATSLPPQLQLPPQQDTLPVGQMQPMQMQILNVHTPTSSYSIVHSLQQETFYALVQKLAKKEGLDEGKVIKNGSANGFIKYEWSDGIWNLDDGESLS